MKTYIRSTGDLNFEGINERDQSLVFSGNGSNVSPMEAVAMSLAACSSIDVEIILKKMRQPLVHFSVEVNAERADAIPGIFTKIHLIYKFTGNLSPDKVKRAIEMSMSTYCSVSKMIEKTAEISYDFEIITP